MGTSSRKTTLLWATIFFSVELKMEITYSSELLAAAYRTIRSHTITKTKM